MTDLKLTPYAALILRITLGLMFIAHSLVLKLFVFTLAGTAQFFETLGPPGPLAYVVFAAEDRRRRHRRARDRPVPGNGERGTSGFDRLGDPGHRRPQAVIGLSRGERAKARPQTPPIVAEIVI